MVESGSPAEWAADAPPILNECVLRFDRGRKRCMIEEKRLRVKNDPSAN